MAETRQMEDWLTLENEYVELTLAPQFGARVTSLIDRRTGRDWLVQGDLVGRQDNEAPFLGPQARGWDECFPTVGRCMSIAWRRTLRDHGDLWGRPWQCVHTPDGISATYTDDQIRFIRTLALDGTSIVASYKATNANETLMPTLWSQHCLLACLPGERLTVEGITDIKAGGQPINLTSVGGTDFTTVHDLDSRLALKAYGTLKDQARISVAGDNGGIAFSWSAEDAPFVGFWFGYGGWPEDASIHQLAIEPTTSPTDDLAGALAGEHAVWLKPVQSRSWKSTITLLEPQ